MEAVAHACREGRVRARVSAVVSDRERAGGLARAARLGIPTELLPAEGHSDRAAYGDALAALVGGHSPDLVLLAGFMRILAPRFIARFGDRLLNIHPSLLPAYPGLATHRRVLEAGEHFHGCTVHFVTDQLDAGPAVIQARLAVAPQDTEQTLSARVQRWEHIIFPEAAGWFAEGRLSCRDGAAWLDGVRLEEPILRTEA